jgi:hypothetical protein
VCGTCLTGVIEGEPDHKDVYLTPGAGKERPVPALLLPFEITDVVLDL